MGAGYGGTATALWYSPRLVERHLHLAGGLSRFMFQHGLAVEDVSRGVIEQVVADLRVRNRSWRPTAKSLSWLVDYLIDIGVIGVVVESARRSSGRPSALWRSHRWLRSRGTAFTKDSSSS